MQKQAKSTKPARRGYRQQSPQNLPKGGRLGSRGDPWHRPRTKKLLILIFCVITTTTTKRTTLHPRVNIMRIKDKKTFYSIAPDPTNELRGRAGVYFTVKDSSSIFYVNPQDQLLQVELIWPSGLKKTTNFPKNWISFLTKNVIFGVHQNVPWRLEYALYGLNPQQPGKFLAPGQNRAKIGILELKEKVEKSRFLDSNCQIKSTWVTDGAPFKLVAVIYPIKDVFLMNYDQKSDSIQSLKSPKNGPVDAKDQHYRLDLSSLTPSGIQIRHEEQLKGEFLTTKKSVYFLVVYRSSPQNYQLLIKKINLAAGTASQRSISSTEKISLEKFHGLLKIAKHGLAVKFERSQPTYDFSSTYYRIDRSKLVACRIFDDVNLCFEEINHGIKHTRIDLQSVPRSNYLVLRTLPNSKNLEIQIFELLPNFKLVRLLVSSSKATRPTGSHPMDGFIAYQDFTTFGLETLAAPSSGKHNVLLGEFSSALNPNAHCRNQFSSRLPEVKNWEFFSDLAGKFNCVKKDQKFLRGCDKVQHFTLSCLACKPGWEPFLAKNPKFAPNLKICKNPSLSCQPPFYLNEAMDGCYDCRASVKNCGRCQNMQKRCLVCNKGFRLDRGTGRCQDPCKAGEFWTGLESGVNTCLGCDYVFNKCLRCGFEGGDLRCFSCAQGYLLDPNSARCLKIGVNAPNGRQNGYFDQRGRFSQRNSHTNIRGGVGGISAGRGQNFGVGGPGWGLRGRAGLVGRHNHNNWKNLKGYDGLSGRNWRGGVGRARGYPLLDQYWPIIEGINVADLLGGSSRLTPKALQLLAEREKRKRRGQLKTQKTQNEKKKIPKNSKKNETKSDKNGSKSPELIDIYSDALESKLVFVYDTPTVKNFTQGSKQLENLGVSLIQNNRSQKLKTGKPSPGVTSRTQELPLNLTNISIDDGTFRIESMGGHGGSQTSSNAHRRLMTSSTNQTVSFPVSLKISSCTPQSRTLE